MASAAPLKDIDEQFLQCVICLDQLKEPALLPCLHRYCRGCLRKIVKEKDEQIECPTCREKHDIPKNGVDGFKGDFNTQNIIEFVQLQDSAKQEPMKICANCSKKLKVASYCFRCNDFLCQSCDEHHKTSKIVKDHRPHIFSLDEAEARSLTIEKLSSLREAPRCQEHPEKVSELCCTTCDNLPICIACMYGEHQGHTLKEVKSLAKIEREKLTDKLADLKQHREKFCKMQDQIKTTKEQLSHTVGEEKRKLIEVLNVEEGKVKLEIRNIDDELKRQQTRLEKELAKTVSSRKQDLEKEIKQLRDKYDKVCEEERREADAMYKDLKRENEEEKALLQTNFDTINKEIRKLLKSIETQEEESMTKIKELFDDLDGIMKKFEVITTTASSILSAKNDWTDVQCIPDICAAIVPLMEETRAIPDLETLSSITVGKLSHTKVNMTEKEESVVSIEGINEGWYINDITTNKNGTIVVTGHVPPDKSHITVVNQEGEQLRQDTYETTSEWPWRYCEFLSEFKIVTADQSSALGIYDIRDGAYRQVNIDSIISSCPRGWKVHCMTVDTSKNRIIVGGWRSRDLFVFNNDLKYRYSLKLPTKIEWPKEILALKGGNFLVCDWDGMRAYRVTRTGSKCKLSFEFSKPQVDGDEWRPSSVCRGENGLIYILWVSCRVPERGIVVQYSQHGRQLMATRSLDQRYYSRRITTIDMEGGQKLLIPTYKTGQLVTYGFE